eukprot:TRINITY_DN21_c0_g1_i7.p1 TRINITY_DN21_c0_g1~~TRINITY_DN21_c0_g1_i7.p1  ORF type:complete len:170 (+),score=6.69 TRINITY_DN21_c0_g1_i7:64-573(+)
MNTFPILTTKPEYYGLNMLYSFAGTPVFTERTTQWGCFNGRATGLTGREIGHAEMCSAFTTGGPGTWVTKLVVEDVGTLVVAAKVEQVQFEISPDTTASAIWSQIVTLLPETEGSFLSYLSSGQFKKWRGYCYLDGDLHSTQTGGLGVADFPRVFYDCSYRKPEHQKRT